MVNSRQTIADHAVSLAAEMPLAMVEKLAETIEHIDPSDWQALRAWILQQVPQAHYRSLAAGLLETWHTNSIHMVWDSPGFNTIGMAEVSRRTRSAQAWGSWAMIGQVL